MLCSFSLQKIFFSEQPFYGNYSTLDSHTNTVISHAFAYSSRWRRKPRQGLYHNHALSSSRSNSNIKPRNEYKREQEVRFFKLQRLSRILKYHNHALSTKYSICNIQLLPLDLRKKAFDEFRLNMLIFMVSFTENCPLRLSLNIHTGQKDSREVLETTS